MNIVSDLAGFLLARIGEDEGAAGKAIGLHWHAQGGPELRTEAHDSPGMVEPCWFQIAVGGQDEGPHEWEPSAAVPDPTYTAYWARMDTFRFIERHDPARVLAECEAKRRIVETVRENAEWDEAKDKSIDGPDYWVARELARDDALTILRLLALPFADHPGYREEWRP